MIFCLLLSVGLENAKVVGWVLEVCGSDTTTFFSCIVKGTAGSTTYKLLFSQVHMETLQLVGHYV